MKVMNERIMIKKGFTLAEVLVTLVIIGVISALAIPAFMNNANNTEYRSSFKKAVAGVNQALAKNYALSGSSAHDYTSAELVVSSIFQNQMNVITGNDTFTSDDCNGVVFTLDDGMIFCVANYLSEYSDEKGSVCDFHNTEPCTETEGPNLWIDVNGKRKPNKLTVSHLMPKDIYTAQIYSQKVIPYGEAAQNVLFERTSYDK